MKGARLGRTGLEVSRIGFGVLQIAGKYDYPHTERMLNLGLDSGINILDTAHGYRNSEERIGRAIAHRRDEFSIATKSGGQTRKEFWEALEESLRRLRTDYVDIYQFHGAETGSENYIFQGEETIECMRQAQEQGKIRFIGFSSHSLEGSLNHVRSGAFDVAQYPISYVGDEAAERGLVEEASRLDVGFLGMKPFGGGRLGQARYCLGYVLQFPSVVPVIGFETESELREVVELAETGVKLTDSDRSEMAKIKAELGERFCRGCNYCAPCPQRVPILSVMFFDVYRKQFGDDWVSRDEYREDIEAVAHCEECRRCVERCPFNLEIPNIMREIAAHYEELMEARRAD
jgi:predicted aldo/keto reductase-like oxidoreductase